MVSRKKKKVPKKKEITEDLSDLEKEIIEMTLKLISEEGYSKVSARKIAREVGISVSTLFYHFKGGKLEILSKLTSKFKDYLKLDEILSDGVVDEDEIRQFFYKDLDSARRMRPFLIAMDIEMLNNPDFYLSQAKNISFGKEITPFRRFFEGIAGKEVSDDKFMKILAVFKILLRRHIIMRNFFGSDDEFMEMMVNIIKALA